MKNSSDFITKLMGFGETKNSRYLLYELNNCGTLEDLFLAKGFLNESSARILLQQMVRGLQDMKKYNLRHRTLNPKTIQINSRQIPSSSTEALVQGKPHEEVVV